ncbi:MAG: tRNA (N6-threonylcarbamoyladenosine(37)-N6)-methyltransferase TrmO [Thermoplasmata archaeon]
MEGSELERYEVKPIGRAENDYENEIPDDYKDRVTKIVIYEEYGDALLGIEEHSHIVILSWFHESDRTIHRVHPMADMDNPLTGVFATRSPVRPNPIAITVCELVDMEENILHVKGLDVYNNTPIVDIKSYTTKYKIEGPKYPDWVPDRE